MLIPSHNIIKNVLSNGGLRMCEYKISIPTLILKLSIPFKWEEKEILFDLVGFRV